MTTQCKGPTGKTRHRTGWGGKLILQVEVQAYEGSWFDGWDMVDGKGWYTYWRDAELSDLSTTVRRST